MSILSIIVVVVVIGKLFWGCLVGWGLFFVIFVWFWKGVEMNLVVLFCDVGNMVIFVVDFFLLDFGNWKFYFSEMLVIVQIVFWGMVLVIVCVILLLILVFENIVFWWVYQLVWWVMDVCCLINEMVFVMFFVVVVGLGLFVGVLVLFISIIGVFVKFFVEVVEVIDFGLVEGVCVIGVSVLQEVIFGVILQVLLLWIFYLLYCFEFNVCFVIVVGMVGVGGIGVIFWEVICGFQFGQICVVLIVIIVVVSLIDVLL